MKFMKEGFIQGFVSAILISIVIICVISFVIYEKMLVGPILILLGFIPWIPLKLAGREIKSVGADIIFGIIDTGILGIAALIGANAQRWLTHYKVPSLADAAAYLPFEILSYLRGSTNFMKDVYR